MSGRSENRRLVKRGLWPDSLQDDTIRDLIDQANQQSGEASGIETDLDTDITGLAAHIVDKTTHGTTGDIVGTSDSQVLSNKTLGSDLDVAGYLLKNPAGFGGSAGKAVVFADQYADDLDNAVAAGTAPFMVYHKGAWFFVTGTNIVEQAQRHCIINGSFERAEGGVVEFWTHKP